jgi:hypothetical protein
MSDLNGTTLAALANRRAQRSDRREDARPAICLSIEQIGLLRTIDGLLAVLKFFSEECPGEFAALRAMHSPSRGQA